MADLSEEQLRRPVLPSGWTCLGLVQQLTLSDERCWFEVVMAGHPLDFWPEGDNADWQVSSNVPAGSVIDDIPDSDRAFGRLPGRPWARCSAGPAGGLVD